MICVYTGEVAKMTEMFVVRSRIKDLNEEVVALIKKACERAKANKRSTIQARDLYMGKFMY